MDHEVVLKLAEDGADTERLDSLARDLRDELLSLDVDDVRQLRAGEAPPGTKMVDPMVVGALLVSLTTSSELVVRMVTAIRGWKARGSSHRRIELTIGDRSIILDDASAEEQARLMQEFLQAGERPAGG